MLNKTENGKLVEMLVGEKHQQGRNNFSEKVNIDYLFIKMKLCISHLCYLQCLYLVNLKSQFKFQINVLYLSGC